MNVRSTNSLLFFSFFKILLLFIIIFYFLEDFYTWSTTLVTIFGGSDIQVDDPPNILLFLSIYFLTLNDLVLS